MVFAQADPAANLVIGVAFEFVPGGVLKIVVRGCCSSQSLDCQFPCHQRVEDGAAVPTGCMYISGDRPLLVSRFTKLPWIPSDEQWCATLEVAKGESLRNRLMLALAYDAGLRREELCLLRTDDVDPAHRMLRIRAETTKGRRERVVPYSAVTGALLRAYLDERRSLSSARGPLLLSTSPATVPHRSRYGPGRRSCDEWVTARMCRVSARIRCGICA
jgi:integrase